MNNKDEGKQDIIRTKIWEEVPENDNPFSARECYCCGYDVYGELIRKASWVEYLYLLFCRERPSNTETRLLEVLAIALANPGPRDYSVRAAMSASAGGAFASACLMSAISVGSGQYGGARELFLSMESLSGSNCIVPDFVSVLHSQMQEAPENAATWCKLQHPAGFAPYDTKCATPVQRTLDYLAEIYGEGYLGWLTANQEDIEKEVGYPLSFVGVSAAAFLDIGMLPQQGELLYLLLRLPGAAVHAIEQYMQWKHYPFFADGIELVDDTMRENRSQK